MFYFNWHEPRGSFEDFNFKAVKSITGIKVLGKYVYSIKKLMLACIMS